jgi:hypothetical protein
MYMELTDVRIRAAKRQEKPYKLRDGKGLVLPRQAEWIAPLAFAIRARRC